MFKKIIAALILLVLGLFFYTFFINSPAKMVGNPAPGFEATLISGEDFSLSDLQGKYVLIDFWGSWCAPCRKEMPALKTLYNKFNNQNFKDASGFEIVSIALERSDKQTRKVIEQEQLNWPYHIIDVSRIVLMSSYAQKYGVSELPTKILINPKGEIMGTNLGFKEMDRLLGDRI